ncbi:MAG: tRNA (adenosine(37)-N6)-dimethylallyltransferase MiaA, partial [Deltaproteobacteria bacterium]|nr:tRNA (adenosine(37)-N6)-dimethylallyltransferase MiaA [Deltaproteobacteria bacterium]
VDPLSASRIHPNNIHRVIRALEVYSSTGSPISSLQKEHGRGESDYDCLKIGLMKERPLLYRDIEKRVDRMMEDGLLAETQNLVRMGYGAELKSMRSLGYREMRDYTGKRRSLDSAVSEFKKNTRNYAKRQITWFKKDKEVLWFSPEDKPGIISLVRDFYSDSYSRSR